MRRMISVLGAALLAGTAILGSGAPASADGAPWSYAAYSAAAQVNALGTAINAGPLVPSSMVGNTYPNQTSVPAAAVNVNSVATIVAAEGSQKATEFFGEFNLSSTSEIARINLLNGLVTADAIRTTSTAYAGEGGLDGSTNTEFVNLKLAGNTVTVDIKKNSRITIPGIANIVLNEEETTVAGGAVLSRGTAIHVTLLKARAGAPAGAEVMVNPTYAQLFPTQPVTSPVLSGEAYSTFAAAAVGNSAKVLAAPTGVISLPSTGTNGEPIQTSAVGARIPNVLTTGVLKNTVQGTSFPGFGDARTESEIASIKLLNGVIALNGVRVNAHVRKSEAESISEASMNFVSLTIAGRTIPVNVKPNTVINVAGIAKVFINQQFISENAARVIGLRVVLSTAKYGLPIGADIQVAVAAARVD